MNVSSQYFAMALSQLLRKQKQTIAKIQPMTKVTAKVKQPIIVQTVKQLFAVLNFVLLFFPIVSKVKILKFHSF